MERGLEDMSSILKVEDLVKYYGEGENQVRAVDHTSFTDRERQVYSYRRTFRLRKIYTSASDWRA